MQSNTENFLIWGFQKLLQDKEIKKNQNQQLKKCCESMLAELRESIVENGNVSSVLPAVKSDGDNIMSNSKYFEPFELALTSKSQTVVVTALDCLQKLIAYGHISNTAPYKESKERLIEKIVFYVCDCFQNGSAGDNVQLQIIKAILTIINNNDLEIHENNLISMVRTCYSIFLACKDPVIQHTAKGTLTQMLNTIFSRMETKTMEEYSHISNNVINEEVEIEDNEDNKSESISENSEENLKESESKDVALEIIDDIIDSAVKGKDFNNADCSTTPKNFAHIYQKDAFLVFRCLCKLSLKALPEGLPDPRSHDLRSKILSLELLLNILQNSGPVFKQSEVFINAIKQYLCVALSKNGVSSVPDVFELSLSIFLSLLSSFKQHLKRQNEVFFKEIFLYILESPRSSFTHKDLVLEALKRICLNAQCVVDIYLNYDCDLTLANIFERLVNDLAKIAQGRQTGDLSTIQQAKQLRIKALDCLYNILKCMVAWSNELYVSPESLSFFGVESERHEGVVGSGVAPKMEKIINKIDSMNSINTRSSSQSSLVGTGVTGNSVSQDNPEDFASRKQQKELFEQGISLFNKKPLKGLNFLQNQSLLGTNVEDVAEFLHKDERLNKTIIGDFLGENERYNIEVMYAYVDQFDFTGTEFVSALREFLAGFRLPGEAQKIDRLMEKFAARYCECNASNTPFKSADTAYILAYSIIMLTTDLHSSQIKKRNRMRKEDYIKMNRGINGTDDLDVEYLGKIYDEIADNEIKMKDTNVDRKPSNKVSGAATEKQRELLFNMEVEEMGKAAKELMESISHIESDFTSATQQEHVKTMFKLVWTPFLAAFSVGLQDCDDNQISYFCLEGIRCAIRIACIFKMELERNAYIQALSRFTLLITGASSDGIKSKNIDTIKTLIYVAHSDGNYLDSSWLEILRCISQLESAQLIGTTGPPHAKVISESTRKSNSIKFTENLHGKSVTGNDNFQDSHFTPINLSMLLSEYQKHFSMLQEVMGETGSQSVIVAVDKVFTGSVRLDGDAIVEFVKALCQVSRDELSVPQPRIFSLQKLVEISYYNMGRIRLQWSKVWNIIGEHFTNAGRSPNEDVAIFAMDSLRQLAVKFIEKGEFPNFHFQKDFLRPFVNIMEDKSHLTKNVEDMVVRCVAQLIKSHWSNIRSGWSNVFLVFQKAASGASIQNESIVEMAFESLSFVVKEVFKTSFHLVVDSFHNLVKSLAEFACNTNFPDLNMESIRLLRQCARYVDEQGHLFREITVGSENAVISDSEDITLLDDEDRTWLLGWMPVLCELYGIINNCKLDVRTRGLTVFFEIVKSYGNRYRPRWWRDTFNLVFRVFQHMPLSSNNQENASGIRVFTASNDRSEWLNTTCNHTLYAVVDVFSQYYDILHTVLLDDLFMKLKWCCLQDYEQLARSGTSCIETVILSNGHKFVPDTWEKAVSLLEDVFKQTTPYQLLTWKPNMVSSKIRESSETLNGSNNVSLGNENKFQTFSSLLVKCVVQFELIQAVGNIVFYPSATKREDAELWRRASQLGALSNDEGFGSGNNYRRQSLDCSNRGGSEPPITKESISEVDGQSIDTRGRSMRSESSISNLDISVDEQLNHWGTELPREGLYSHLTASQLYRLVNCLLESHNFAKGFNCDQEQRNLLWKAGFKGKAKPNLMKQETHSLSLAIRIMFRLIEDPKLKDSDLNVEEVESRLIGTLKESLHYYRDVVCCSQTSTEQHRDVWSPIIVLVLSRLTQPALPAHQPSAITLTDLKFKEFACHLYFLLCDLVTVSGLPMQIRVLYRTFLIRFGHIFDNITS